MADKFFTTDQVNGTANPLQGASSSSTFFSAANSVLDIFRNAGQNADDQLDTSESFLASRGTFYRVPLRSGTGPGMYAVEGLSQFIDDARRERELEERRKAFEEAGVEEVAPSEETTNPSRFAFFKGRKQRALEAKRRQSDELRRVAAERANAGSTPILIMGIQIAQNDITSQMSCLSNIKVFYTFGQAFGNVTISGEMLLGPLGNIQADGVRILMEFFNAYRSSTRKSTMSFSIAQTAYQMYLTGLVIGNVDVNFHVLPFVMTGVLVDPSRQNESLLNPANEVIKVSDVSTATTGTVASGEFNTAASTQPTASVSQRAQFNTSTVTADSKPEIQKLVDEYNSTVDTDPTTAAFLKENIDQKIADNQQQLPAGETTASGQQMQDVVAARQTVSSNPNEDLLEQNDRVLTSKGLK